MGRERGRGQREREKGMEEERKGGKKEERDSGKYVVTWILNQEVLFYLLSIFLVI